MSLNASGTLGKTLTAASWKGRSYMRLRVIPSNPRSPAQTGNRAMMKFLAQIWAGLSSPTQASWDDLAKQGQYSPFNAFVSINQSRYATGRAPTAEYPAAEATTPATPALITATGGVRLAAVDIDPTLSTNTWGWLLCRDLTTGFTPSAANCIAVLPLGIGNAFTYTDTPLVPDTYYYNLLPFSEDGVYGTESIEASAMVT